MQRLSDRRLGVAGPDSRLGTGRLGDTGLSTGAALDVEGGGGAPGQGAAMEALVEPFGPSAAVAQQGVVRPLRLTPVPLVRTTPSRSASRRRARVLTVGTAVLDLVG